MSKSSANISWGGRKDTNIESVLGGYLIEVFDGLKDDVRHAIIDEGQIGAETMEIFIATRGVSNENKQGRIDTGAMLDTIDSSVLRDDEAGIEVEYGYIDNPVDYDIFQEFGFDHVHGMHIPGVFAARDAAIQTEINLEMRDLKSLRRGRR